MATEMNNLQGESQDGCTCISYPMIATTIYNPLCPVHGDVRDTGFVIDNKDDRITAIENAIEELDQEQERQARLIAAAPELLEALEAILAFMGRDKEPVADHKVWMNAHIAIAKARDQS